MKKRYSKWIAILTIATLLAGQTVTVWAEETSDVTETSEIGTEESVTEESATECGETRSDVESNETTGTETIIETDEATETEADVETDEVVESESAVETEVSEESVVETEVATEVVEEDSTVIETEVETATEISSEAVVENLADVPMLLAEEGETAVTLLSPQNVQWADGYDSFDFDDSNTESHWIMAELQKDGERVFAGFGHSDYFEPDEIRLWYLKEWINESGDYRGCVYFVDGNLSNEEFLNIYKDSEYVAYTEVLTYTNPGRLDTVANIKFDETGRVSWDAVEHAEYYTLKLYTNDDKDGAIFFVEGTQKDLLSYLTEGNEYAVTVKAISEDILTYGNSVESERVQIEGGEAVNVVNNTLNAALDNLTEDSSAEDVKAAVDTVKSSFASTEDKRELQLAMQTNDETQSQIAEMEALYADAMQVDTKVTCDAEEIGIAANDIKLLGAVLNAEEAGEVAFSVTKPSQVLVDALLGKVAVKNSIIFSMDIAGAGVNSNNLAVPITITMPKPIDTSYVGIYHFTSENEYEPVTVRNNPDGTISFTITHFSEFVFYEVEDTSSSNPSDSSSTNSSSSSKKKVVKPWVPTTEDEKARYSVFGREKLDYIVGTEGGYKAELVNIMQGRLFFDAVDAAKGDYTIARTYNVEIDGKLVYETAMPAMFVLDIPTEYQAAGRDYKMVCVTQNGEVIILDDLDTEVGTITFLTNKFYAFALIYKDTVVAE